MKPLRGFQRTEIKKLDPDFKAKLWQTDENWLGRRPYSILELTRK